MHGTLISLELLGDGADSDPALDAVAQCYDIFFTFVSGIGFCVFLVVVVDVA